MALTYEGLIALTNKDVEVEWAEKDSILYALSVGMASGGIEEPSLPFVYEGRPMRAVPTFASILSRPLINESGIDFRYMLHGEQRLKLHREIPASGSLIVDSSVSSVIDKGADKGSVVTFQSSGRLRTGEAVFTAEFVMLARGDGGFGSPDGKVISPHPIPDREPEKTIELQVRNDQALLYRLNQDRNPLHVDPKAAASAGFQAPILHGLCTYGMICGALIRAQCEYDPGRIAAFDVRFTGPVYAGDTLALDVWEDDGVVSFRCRAPARDKVVIDNGRCLLRLKS